MNTHIYLKDLCCHWKEDKEMGARLLGDADLMLLTHDAPHLVRPFNIH